jgi:Domain of unknown function (DUF4402)
VHGRSFTWGRAICALLSLAAAPATAAPASASANAQVKVTVTKPLVLTFVQDLNLGTILIQNGGWSSATVGISRAGLFTCSPNLVCSGTQQVATYRVAGTNNQAVTITAPDVTLVNQSDASKSLTLVVDNPRTVTLPNSGNVGVEFSLGGSITVAPSTVDGSYSGTFNVTVDY